GLSYAEELCSKLAASGMEAVPTGQCRRASEIIESVKILVEGGAEDLDRVISVLGMDRTSLRGNTLIIESHAGRPPAEVSLADRDIMPIRLLLATGSERHVSELRRIAAGMNLEIRDDGLFRDGVRIDVHGEKDIYAALGLSYLPPEVREGRDCEITLASADRMPVLIAMEDIRGTIHIHTSASDGTVTLEGMVLAARARGYEWIGISDHSRSAFYAGGLDDDAVRQQHREIEALNRTLEGITVLKGIESDILEDGSLDYPPEVLSEFDFVVASIHTHMDMDKKSMTKRIVRALKNPFTTILGHPTGRLLLSREPFSVDMEAVLAAALEAKVAVELNAHPLRLDLDWRLMEPFVGRGGIVALIGAATFIGFRD
ncbi:histidinol-phosphatase, partial [bacterium]|nr:histidinol-phosphatase [bacterium]